MTLHELDTANTEENLALITLSGTHVMFGFCTCIPVAWTVHIVEILSAAGSCRIALCDCTRLKIRLHNPYRL